MDATVGEEELEGLIRDARAGSQDALGRLLEHFRPYLACMAREEASSDLRLKEPPSDLVQKSFLEASGAFRDFQGGSPDEVKAWLAQILRNNVRDLRDRYHAAKRDVARETPALNAWPQDHEATGASPSSEAARREQAEAIQASLAKLPPESSELILWRHRDHLAFAEIASRLAISEQAARKRWARAVEELRRLVRGNSSSSEQ